MKKFKGSIGKKLLILFLLISLIPIIIIGIVINKSSSSTYLKSASEQLEAVGNLKYLNLRSYLYQMSRITKIVARNPIVISKLKEIENSNYKDLSKYLESDNYKKSTSNIDKYMKEYSSDFAFYDIFLINSNGDIVYSIKKESDFGTNLYSERYKNTSLAKSVRNAKNKKMDSITDYELYAPSGNIPAGFITNCIYDNNNSVLGFVAFQIPYSFIEEIVTDGSGLGKTGETYIVGEDLLLRSELRFSKENTILKRRIDTYPTNYFFSLFKHRDPNNKNGTIFPTQKTKNYDGTYVLSSARLMGLQELFNSDFDWLIVTEIEVAEILEPARNLAIKFGTFSIVLLLLIIIASIIISRGFSKPIKQLTEISSKIADGDFEQEINISSNNEIGELAASLGFMKDNLFKTIKHAEAIASGDYTTIVEPHSEKDTLGIALHKMTNDLKSKDEYNSAILNSTQAGVVLINADTHIIEYANPVAIDMIGAEKENIIGQVCNKFICPSQVGECPISDLGLTVDHSEKVLLTANGEEHPILKTVKQIEIGGKNLFIETFIDILEMKQLQNQISDDEIKYRTMFQSSPAAIIMTDSEKVIDVNDRIVDWLGYDANSIIGVPVIELPFFTKESISKIIQKNEIRHTAETMPSYELDLVSKSGEKYSGRILVNYIKNKQQKIVKEIVTILDITKEKGSAEIIKSQEHKFRSMFDSVDDAIYLFGKEKFIDCNKATLKLFNIKSKKDFLEIDPRRLSPKTQPGGSNSYRASITEMRKTLRDGYNKFEWVHNTLDGKEFPVEVSSTKIKTENESFIHINVRDITERKQHIDLINQRNIEIEKNNWFIQGLKQLTDKMQGDLEIQKLSDNIITFLAKYLNAQLGALYLAEDMELTLAGTYAFAKTKMKKFKFGEGLVGQSALEKELINISDVPEDYITINNAFGEAVPKNIIVVPFMFNKKVLGIIELGSIKQFANQELEFIKNSMDDIGIAVSSAFARRKAQRLLIETQDQATELQAQQEELRVTNEELEEQTEEIKSAQSKLEEQQEELKATNANLEEKTETLEKQKKRIDEKNQSLIKARQELQKKAEDLEIASKYKSEFLANMSHELRTPLNSLLILSKNLANNKKEHLDEREIESADIIYNSGNDLLNLINEILDLSKVEAGKMTTNIESVELEEIRASLNRNFIHQTKQKNLFLNVTIEDDVPEIIVTDRQRVEQIIKNLLSNALKFTEQGGISVKFHRPEKETDLSRSGLEPNKTIGISIIDTGIGIPKEKQVAIFEAFQQADGTTSRRFGGTGLGLSISRELSKLLGGELQLKSETGKGSSFTVYLPEQTEGKAEPDEIKDRRKTERRIEADEVIKKKEKLQNVTIPAPSIADDRNNITKEDKIILVVEDDLNFAKTLKGVCKDKEFKFLHSGDGETGLKLAKKYLPNGIILDIELPGIDGWEVLEIIKANNSIRHIPVHIMSAMDMTIDAFNKGAVGFLTKPINNMQLSNAFEKIDDFSDDKVKNILIVEDDVTLRYSVIQLLQDEHVKIDDAKDGKTAVRKLRSSKYDCMILDLTLPDISGFDLLKKLKEDKKITSIPPVIIYTGTDISRDEEFELRKYSDSIIIKGVKSEERLVDETALFLHQVVSDMPKDKQKIISKLHDVDSIFKDKKILVVDDDMRNVFAVSAALEDKNMIISSATNGKKALTKLEIDSKIDLILMDIMMPVMDGYETMGHIRKNKKVKDIPIIALTAKAMKGDKEKCINAGANDYLTKPLNVDRLLSLMRVWLYK